MIKFIWNCIHTHTQIAEVIVRKNTKVGDITLPDFKTYYSAMVIKTA
jgi:hypothetical protein